MLCMYRILLHSMPYVLGPLGYTNRIDLWPGLACLAFNDFKTPLFVSFKEPCEVDRYECAVISSSSLSFTILELSVWFFHSASEISLRPSIEYIHIYSQVQLFKNPIQTLM